MSESQAPSQLSRVLVVGGGITGGVLSLALRQQGVEVVLVDLRPELGGVGHGITLQGNALKAFKSVGIYDRLAERGFPFSHLRLKTADGHVIAEIPTPPMGGPDLPGTMGAVRGDIADILADEVVKAGVDVRLGTTITEIDDRGDSVVATLSDGSTETVDLVVGADGIRSKVRSMIGIEDEPHQVGMGIWRTVAKRPAEMDCSELYYGGPKYKAGYTPISDDLCYAFLLEENLDRSFVGEGPNGALLKERGQGYGGIWGQVRDSLADDAVVNYQWIEAICVDSPVAPRPHDHHRRRRARLPAADRAGRRHVCRGRGGPGRDADQRRQGRGRAAGVHGAPLPAREDGARQQPHPRRVGDPPGDPGRRPRPDHGPDPGCAGRAGLMALLLLVASPASRRPGSTASSTGG